jgi:hypothetical protein
MDYLFIILLQIPTPTPLPDMSIGAPIEIPEWSLWDIAPDAIQVWNSIEAKSGLMTLLQLVLFIGLVLAIGFGITRIISTIFTNPNE